MHAKGQDHQSLEGSRIPLHLRGMTELTNYMKEYQIPIKVTAKKPYSEDENLIHISHEEDILEDPPKSILRMSTA